MSWHVLRAAAQFPKSSESSRNQECTFEQVEQDRMTQDRMTFDEKAKLTAQ